MAKSSKDAYGAVSTFNGLRIRPEDLIIVGEDCDADACEALSDPDRAGPPLASLVDSVAAHGIKEPILVRKVPGVEGVVVVDGRQRVKAARLANERIASQGGEVSVLVPCVVETSATAEDAAVTLVVANEHRREDTPVAKARKAQAMRDLGHDDKAIATMFGVSSTAIKQWSKLLSVDPKVLADVEKGKISASLAIEVARLPPEEQRPAIEEAAKTTGSVAGKAAREVVQRAAVAKETAKASGSTEAPAEVSPAWTKRQIRELAGYLDPNHFEKPEKCSDATWAAWSILAVILGDDPKASGLRGIPTGDFGEGDDLRKVVLAHGPIAEAKKKASESK